MRVAVTLMLAFAATPVAADEWQLDATAGFTAYDNVTRARFPTDHRSATALELDGSAQYQLGWRTAGVATVEVWGGLERFDRFSGLDQVRAGVGAAYFARVGLGPDAPWWSVDARAGYHAFRDDDRAGAAWEAGASTGRAWSSGFELRGRASYHSMVSDSVVFDTTYWRAAVDGDYPLTPRFTAFASVAWLRGELTSSTTAVGPLGPVVAPDPVFGAGWRSYRYEATATTLTLGATLAIGETTQALLSWERLDASARNFNADYGGHLVRVQLRHAF